MAKRMYDLKDMRKWNSNLYLAHEIVFCTNYLLKYQHGYPNSIYQKHKKNEKAAVKEWNSILKQIHDGFRAYYKSDGDFHEWKGGIKPIHEENRLPNGNIEWKWLNNPTLIVNKEKNRKFKTAMKLLARHFHDLWD